MKYESHIHAIKEYKEFCMLHKETIKHFKLKYTKCWTKFVQFS